MHHFGTKYYAFIYSINILWDRTDFLKKNLIYLIKTNILANNLKIINMCPTLAFV